MERHLSSVKLKQGKIMVKCSFLCLLLELVVLYFSIYMRYLLGLCYLIQRRLNSKNLWILVVWEM